MADQNPDYMQQTSSQTLAEGIEEYYKLNNYLLDPDKLGPDLSKLFRAHDAGHVVFGCDTSLRGEALIDTWTVVGTTAGFRGYFEYFKYAEVYNIFEDTGWWKVAEESIRCLPDAGRVIMASRRMTRRWPWYRYDEYFDESLAEIRSRFNIELV